MGKMKNALVRLAKKVTGKEVEDTNSISNVVDFMADEYEGGSGGGVEYIQVYTDGGTLTAEQLAKVFDNGVVKEGVFFRIDNIILISSGQPRNQVFNSTVINGKYYSMEVDEFTGVYTVTEVSVGGGSGANLYVHTIEVKGHNNSVCSFQLVTSDSSQYNYYSLAEYIMSRGIEVYEGQGEEAEPSYWYISASGVVVIPPQTEEGDATFGVAVSLTASLTGGGEEQDYNLTIMGIAFDGDQARDDWFNVQDVVTPMVLSNNNQEEESPVEENPSEEE